MKAIFDSVKAGLLGERVICPALLAREMSGTFVTCSRGGTCGDKRLCGVSS